MQPAASFDMQSFCQHTVRVLLPLWWQLWRTCSCQLVAPWLTPITLCCTGHAQPCWPGGSLLKDMAEPTYALWQVNEWSRLETQQQQQPRDLS